MNAYARLQFETLAPTQGSSIKQALRYSELDTLAMVMTVQAWKGLAGAGDQSTSRSRRLQ